ncbi:MAG: acyloxyacyl hydrolase [Desulfuromonadaceae bacterium]|nr:acyloxyacyl hydrolase [Desulfuromonadaceae bacterium]
MKKHFIMLAALATLTVPTICSAAPSRLGPYVSGFIGVSIPQNTDVSSYNYGTDTSFSDRVEFDPSVNIGGTGGFDYGFIRLEGELSYKHGKIATITEQNGGQSTRLHNADGDLGALAMMFNAFIDLHNSTLITPYLGGGIGFAAMHLSDTFVSEYNTPIYQEDDDTVFAYQAGAGLELALNRRLSLDLGYRYFATSNARFGADRNISTDLKFQSHNAAVGIRVKF